MVVVIMMKMLKDLGGDDGDADDDDDDDGDGEKSAW